MRAVPSLGQEEDSGFPPLAWGQDINEWGPLPPYTVQSAFVAWPLILASRWVQICQPIPCSFSSLFFPSLWFVLSPEDRSRLVPGMWWEGLVPSALTRGRGCPCEGAHGAKRHGAEGLVADLGVFGAGFSGVLESSHVSGVALFEVSAF